MTGSETAVAAPSVGIVTVNYNSAAFIGEFSESLRRVRYPNSRLIVVDSASCDGSGEELVGELDRFGHRRPRHMCRTGVSG